MDVAQFFNFLAANSARTTRRSLVANRQAITLTENRPEFPSSVKTRYAMLRQLAFLTPLSKLSE
jgi:hypothetical protein